MQSRAYQFNRLQQLLFALIGAIVGVLLVTGIGWAHAHLDSATPAEGSRLQEAPKELRLSFTEPIEVAFSSITVTGPGGQNVAGAITQTGITNSISVPLSEMGPGEYTVDWRVLSIDTHTSNGKFTFTILGESSTEPQQPSGSSDGAGSASPSADADEDNGGFGWGWPIVIGVVLGVLVVFMRGRR